MSEHYYPITFMKVEDLLEELNKKVWKTNNNYVVSPMEILNDYTLSKDHMKRILDSDMIYPIVYNSKIGVIDGFHRLAWAFKEGIEYIPVYQITNNLLHAFVLCRNDYIKWDYIRTLTETCLDRLYQWTIN